MELLEYLLFNFNSVSENTVKVLEKLFEKIKDDESVKEEYKKEIYLALGCAKGYTEYKTKELAKTLGVTKTAIKYMINNLLKDDKIEVIKERNISFLKPNISSIETFSEDFEEDSLL